jgi:hypothetical protein
MSWLKDFPDLQAPLTEIHTRYGQYVARQKAQAQAKVERDQPRTAYHGRTAPSAIRHDLKTLRIQPV